jgi:glyoxylase-like metal-dependent hydrolase (beta-lactamase superfamily II)
MKLGDLEFYILSDGELRLDGGAMFGVVPKPLWEKKFPSDERNRIRMGMNCLLIRASAELILVETGAGDKWDARMKDMYGVGVGERLPEQLAAHGVRPADITTVVNTHLHFDHCGWNTHLVNGRAVPFFPNATYIVQRGEIEHALNPTERDRASYLPENFQPVAEAGKWRLLDSDAVVAPGVEVVRAPGHNADMQCVLLHGGGETAIFFADLAPTTAHLPLPWIMSYDLYPLTTLENKKKWIPRAAREGWLALFGHDPQIPAARLKEDKSRYVAEPVKVD